MNNKTIAITGSSGFIGKNLIEHARKRNYNIKALIRDKINTPKYSDIEYIIGDLENRSSLSELSKNADAIIHLAGLTNSHNINKFKAVNVIGTQNLLNSMSKNQTGRIIHISSLAAREKDISAYGLSKYESEAAVQNSDCIWTIIRPPAIYGPYDQDHLQLFKLAKWRIMPIPLRGQVSFMNVDHLCQLILNAIDHTDTYYQRYEVDSGPSHRIDYKSLVALISDIMGHSVLPLPIPERAMMIMSFLEHIFRRGSARLTMDRVGYFGHPDWVISETNPLPQDLLDLSGENFRQGFSDLYLWYKHNRKL